MSWFRDKSLLKDLFLSILGFWLVTASKDLAQAREFLKAPFKIFYDIFKRGMKHA